MDDFDYDDTNDCDCDSYEDSASNEDYMYSEEVNEDYMYSSDYLNSNYD